LAGEDHFWMYYLGLPGFVFVLVVVVVVVVAALWPTLFSFYGGDIWSSLIRFLSSGTPYVNSET